MQLRPIITFTTDFGLVDPFVGTMKGVVAGICPSAQVIDLTHGVAAFDLLEGALAIWQAWRYFPAQTVHVIVVDPGVGSERQPVLSQMGHAWFIAPDNGVLTLVEREARQAGATVEHRRLDNPQYMLPTQSHTFHGRDIFAPAAAHLAVQLERGQVLPETFGPIVENLVQLPVPEPIQKPDGSLEGTILKIDRFGNLLTNLAAKDLQTDDIRNSIDSIEIADLSITRFCRFYAEGALQSPKDDDPQQIFAIVGSSGLLELSIYRGSAHTFTGIKAGTRFRLLPNSAP